MLLKWLASGSSAAHEALCHTRPRCQPPRWRSGRRPVVSPRAVVKHRRALGQRSEGQAARQICTRVPSSTTALSGSLKYSTTLPALRLIAANSLSRHCAMPVPGVGTMVSRLRK